MKPTPSGSHAWRTCLSEPRAQGEGTRKAELPPSQGPLPTSSSGLRAEVVLHRRSAAELVLVGSDEGEGHERPNLASWNAKVMLGADLEDLVAAF